MNLGYSNFDNIANLNEKMNVVIQEKNNYNEYLEKTSTVKALMEI